MSGLRVGDVETCSIVGRIRPEFGLRATFVGSGLWALGFGRSRKPRAESRHPITPS
jgi:hypothetical protein